MTKFLADENIPPAVVKFLRHKGLDVKEVLEFGMTVDVKQQNGIEKDSLKMIGSHFRSSRRIESMFTTYLSFVCQIVKRLVRHYPILRLV